MALENLDWEQILSRLESHATSEIGRESLRNLKPLSSPQAAQESFSRIKEAQHALVKCSRPTMQSLDLCSLWMDRLRKEATLKTLELKDVRLFLNEVMGLKELFEIGDGPWCSHHQENLMDPVPPLSAIDHLMTPSGEIRSDASETLFKLNREKQDQTKRVQEILDQIVKAHKMEAILQDRYVTTREGRWVLPIKSGMQHQFGGIIHASSQSRQTVFMEPKETISINNRLREIDVEIEEEIERLLVGISQYLRNQVDDFFISREILIEADQVFAQTILSVELDAHSCRFSHSTIDLKQVRHPVLVLNQDKVIPNGVQLTKEKRILLLSGPNAGGKTVLLKSVGLAAHMARCGLLICAEEGSSVPFFNHITVAIGDAQNVDDQLSTFAAHLKILDRAATLKGNNNLLLIDEICGSTDPDEGSAIARSFIETYAKNFVFGVVTSHLGPLKLGWPESTGVINGCLEYDSTHGLPTFQLIIGVAGQSLALQTARRVGVNPEILDRALDLLSPEVKAQYQNLTEIEEMKNNLQQLKKNLLEQESKARRQKQKYLDLITQFRNEKDEWLERTIKRAERKMDEMIQADNVRETFKRHDRFNQMKTDFPKIVKHSTTHQRTEQPSTVTEFQTIFPPGTTAFVKSIGRDAIVQGKPNAKGEVPVLSESMRIIVPWKDLSLAKSIKPATRASQFRYEITENHRVIDVRGKHVDEAIGLLESQLDAATLNSEDRIKIIHGHGTDTLKKAIRSHLSRSVYVKKWTTGSPHSGGDGLTWVELK